MGGMRSEEIQAGADAGLEANVESQTLRNDAPIDPHAGAGVTVEASKPHDFGREQNEPNHQNQLTNPVGTQSEVVKENNRMANQVPERSQENVPASEGGALGSPSREAAEITTSEELRSQIPTEERKPEEPNSNASYQDPKRAAGDKP